MEQEKKIYHHFKVEKDVYFNLLKFKAERKLDLTLGEVVTYLVERERESN